MASEGTARESPPLTDEDIDSYFRLIKHVFSDMTTPLIGNLRAVNTKCKFLNEIHKEHFFFTKEQMKADPRITKKYIDDMEQLIRVEPNYRVPETYKDRWADYTGTSRKPRDGTTDEIAKYLETAYHISSIWKEKREKGYKKKSRRKRNKGKGKGKGKTLRR